ncbi:MAG: NADH-quinone oxidoreductase subunit N [Candidatus Pelagibacter sp. TMED64]|nr:NADH-quinone oxidoreductase subunit NuoN [Candidatus Pelagibacter sp.]OUU67551.1 MAG: NADH-quinone oxidoreductase subunit N [Candidatus Pelagibacter sp. TMED64]
MNNIEYIIPELFLSSSILISLIIGVFFKNSFKIVLNFTYITLFLVILLIYNQPNEVQKIFNNSFIIDDLSKLMKILSVSFCLLVLVISNQYVILTKINKFEYPILIMTALLGIIIMISSNDLIIFYMALELQSLSLYVLTSFNRNNLKSTEAGLKFFVLSALSSGLLLYGCSLIYGFNSSVNFNIIANNIDNSNLGTIFGLVFVLVGLAFKISAVPFHMWAPDVYEGSPTSITSFFAIVPKIAAMTVFIRFMYVPFINVIESWQVILVFLSIASMVFSSIAAIGQINIKRLLAYSSIGHMGYALAGISTGTSEGIQSTIIYIIIYSVMNLGIFSSLFLLKKKNIFNEDIKELSGLSKNHPLIGFALLILLFSLAGIPPLAGFFAKFYIFMAVIKSEMYLLAIIGLLSTVISAFYYLRIIKVIYFDKATQEFDEIKNYGAKMVLFITCVFLGLYFINPSSLINLVSAIKFY